MAYAGPPWLTGLPRAVAAYDAGAVLVIAISWLFAMRATALETQSRAVLDDPGRNIALTIVLLSVAFGLASAVVILGRGPHAATAQEKAIEIGLGILAVIAGWIVIHTTFTFRYAHLFYFDDDEDGTAQRGLKFPGNAEPNDYDFAYFSFVIGMTFQVSDVMITDAGVRRVVLVHALISFVYNTAILALGINLVSNLFH